MRTSSPAPTTQTPATVPQRGAQQPRPESATRELKQKKVWQVTSPEDGKERDNREKEHKGGKDNKNR
jgi:hypothetical protein